MQRSIYADEHRDFGDSFCTFLGREVLPYFEEWETAGIVPRDIFREAGRHGFLGFEAPTDFGGAEVEDFRFNAVLGEEGYLAGVAGFVGGITLHNDVCLPYFLAYATPEQRERWLPGLTSGGLLAAIAMTEPSTGSDLAAIRTRAQRRNGGYVVSGAKTFISSGINADLVITVVRTNPEERHRGLSLLVVERGMEGFRRGRNLDKVGLHSADTAELFFDEVHVPAENLLGEENMAFRHLTGNLPKERLSIAVAAVAASRASLRGTVDY